MYATRGNSGTNAHERHPMTKEHAEDKPKQGFLERLTGKTRRASEEEIREMVDDARELADDEKRMINEIIDLGDATANEICTPRVDVMTAAVDETGRAALERMRGTGFSRLPVCSGDIDQVVGIVHYKDLIGPLMDGSIDSPVTNFMYEPMFVPETKDALALLGEMQASHQQMAIVVDEYGGTEGVITVEDIVEEIVGEIADEFDAGGALIEQISDVSWRVDGKFPAEDAARMGWPVDVEGDFETIAGWLLDVSDSVPKMGDELVIDGYKFKIIRMRRSRISQINVEKL
jgi:putative hemolysin